MFFVDSISLRYGKQKFEYIDCSMVKLVPRHYLAHVVKVVSDSKKNNLGFVHKLATLRH